MQNLTVGLQLYKNFKVLCVCVLFACDGTTSTTTTVLVL